MLAAVDPYSAGIKPTVKTRQPQQRRPTATDRPTDRDLQDHASIRRRATTLSQASATRERDDLVKSNCPNPKIRL